MHPKDEAIADTVWMLALLDKSVGVIARTESQAKEAFDRIRNQSSARHTMRTITNERE